MKYTFIEKMGRHIKIILNSETFLCAFLGVITATSFGTQAAVLPNGSTELQNIPAPTVPAKKIPQLTTPATSQAEVLVDANEQKIAIQSFKIVGNTAFTEPQLITSLALLAEQHQWSLSELRQLAQKLTSYYRERGYFLAQAYLPQQDVIDGQVTIAVLEGRLGNIQVQNESTVQDSVATANAREMAVGQVIDIKSLERQVLLLNDLPGVEAKSLIVPGQEVGTADLRLILASTPRIGGVATLDNLGGPYTGINRLGVNLVLNEPLGLGDMLSAYGLTAGPGLSFTRLGYQTQYQAFTLGLAKTALLYQLGDAFASPPRHNSCRPNRTKNLGAAMKDRSWHDTDKHSRTGRLLGCCRLKARLWNWLPGRLALEQKHYSVGAMMFSPCPPEGGHGLRRRVCRL